MMFPTPMTETPGRFAVLWDEPLDDWAWADQCRGFATEAEARAFAQHIVDDAIGTLDGIYETTNIRERPSAWRNNVLWYFDVVRVLYESPSRQSMR